MLTEVELGKESLQFEYKHNNLYRYSKLNGKIPLQVLSQMGSRRLRFPPKESAPRTPLKKPESGCFHLVRFIRSNRKLDVFGELFSLSSEYQYEYVVATTDVKEQKLNLTPTADFHQRSEECRAKRLFALQPA